ncbi:MAG: hypothetical protein L3J83_03685 [Proteobacteria bacterium]|nr:hypothetical protein [Pseudomonadota bacterium]
MRLFIVFIVLILSGCYSAKYNFTRCTAIDVCSTATIKSKRDFPNGISVSYNVETKSFEILANKVVTAPDPFEKIGKDVVTGLINKYLNGEK